MKYSRKKIKKQLYIQIYKAGAQKQSMSWKYEFINCLHILFMVFESKRLMKLLNRESIVKNAKNMGQVP